jgi:hypothetical protein
MIRSWKIWNEGPAYDGRKSISGVRDQIVVGCPQCGSHQLSLYPGKNRRGTGTGFSSVPAPPLDGPCPPPLADVAARAKRARDGMKNEAPENGFVGRRQSTSLSVAHPQPLDFVTIATVITSAKRPLIHRGVVELSLVAAPSPARDWRLGPARAAPASHAAAKGLRRRRLRTLQRKKMFGARKKTPILC